MDVRVCEWICTTDSQMEICHTNKVHETLTAGQIEQWHNNITTLNSLHDNIAISAKRYFYLSPFVNCKLCPPALNVVNICFIL